MQSLCLCSNSTAIISFTILPLTYLFEMHHASTHDVCVRVYSLGMIPLYWYAFFDTRKLCPTIHSTFPRKQLLIHNIEWRWMGEWAIGGRFLHRRHTDGTDKIRYSDACKIFRLNDSSHALADAYDMQTGCYCTTSYMTEVRLVDTHTHTCDYSCRVARQLHCTRSNIFSFIYDVWVVALHTHCLRYWNSTLWNSLNFQKISC